MTERRYLPADYLDEVVPTPRPSPSEWIVTLPGNSYALVPIEEDDEEPSHFLRAGDVVEFNWIESYGLIEVTIAADGSFTSSRTPDPRANCVWIPWDSETIDESIASFARNWIKNRIGYGKKPTTIELEQYAWSAQSERYRFELSSSGPRFVLVEA